MIQQAATWIAGEVYCLNCGTVLAEVVRSAEDGTVSLRPAKDQSTVQVFVANRRLLRCRRCRGRALVELFDHPIEQTDAESRGKCYPIA